MVTSVYIVFLIIGAVLGGDDNQVKLRFYHSTFDNYTELPTDKAINIFSSSWYNSNRSTTIFCHGFTGKYWEALLTLIKISFVGISASFGLSMQHTQRKGHPNGPAVSAIIKSYLQYQQSNVILLNWERQAASIYNQMSASYLQWAVPNAVRLGADFADVLLTLSAAGLDLQSTHLVGHSLGAHVFGITGNKLMEKGVKLPWITGLDPAGISFDRKTESERLNPKSAKFVDVIHSDPSKYGSRLQLGTIDFWPNYKNGPVRQPGCDSRFPPRFSPEDLCNHNRCWQYLIDAMKYPKKMIASYAKNYSTWKRYTKPERSAVVLELGVYYENLKPGNYYFVTRASSPYGLGENGL